MENLNVSKGDDNFKAGKTNLKAELIWEGFPEDIEVNNIRGEISFNLKDIIIKEIDTENSVSDLLKLISLFNVSNTLGDITNLQFREKFKPRRGRINCSLNDQNIWRWFGVQFVLEEN